MRRQQRWGEESVRMRMIRQRQKGGHSKNVISDACWRYDKAEKRATSRRRSRFDKEKWRKTNWMIQSTNISEFVLQCRKDHSILQLAVCRHGICSHVQLAKDWKEERTQYLGRTTILTTFETAFAEAGNNGTGTKTLFAVNDFSDAEGTRPMPAVVSLAFPVLLLFFRPISANTLLAADEVEVRDFVNLKNDVDSRFRRIVEVVASGRQW